jgi:succinoglycan biosynthesis protein ExoA
MSIKEKQTGNSESAISENRHTPVGCVFASKHGTIIPEHRCTLFISVIVPVRNEAEHIEHVLHQLIQQDYDQQYFEIIVIDGLSTDGTPDLVANYAKKYTNIRLYSNPKRLSSAARNIGIRQSRGDVVLIVDGHCELKDDMLLCKLAEAYQRSGADCLGRPQPQEVAGSTPLQQAIALARASRLGHHPASYIYSSKESFVPAQSVAVAYCRKVFNKVGLFDEHFDACEDVEFNYRVDQAGLRCFFTPDIAVHYQPRGSLRGLFRQLFRYGRGRVCLFRKHPETFTIGSFVPALFWLGVLFGWIGGFRWPVLWLAYFGALGLYGVVILLGVVLIAFSHKQIRLLPLLPLILVTIHLASATGVICGLLKDIRTRQSFNNK